MKRIIAVLFLGIHLFSTTEMYQLLKLPLVFEHYQEHKMADKNISFLGFLAMHYLDNEPKDGDYQRDMRLPFKKTNHYITSTSPIGIPGSYVEIPSLKTIFARKAYFIGNENFIPSEFLAAIFQPPRFS